MGQTEYQGNKNNVVGGANPSVDLKGFEEQSEMIVASNVYKILSKDFQRVVESRDNKEERIVGGIVDRYGRILEILDPGDHKTLEGMKGEVYEGLSDNVKARYPSGKHELHAFRFRVFPRGDPYPLNLSLMTEDPLPEKAQIVLEKTAEMAKGRIPAEF
ncbi:MAG: hypothetical protein V1744_05295 [Candidatus Altiarchaeota archaeon]